MNVLPASSLGGTANSAGGTFGEVGVGSEPQVPCSGLGECVGLGSSETAPWELFGSCEIGPRFRGPPKLDSVPTMVDSLSAAA